MVGQPFKELVVDAEFHAVEIGNVKAWYPPATIIDFKARPGRPVLFKVTNSSSAEHGFLLTADEAFGAPTVLKAQIVLKPGETKYIGIPTSDPLLRYNGRDIEISLPSASGPRRRDLADDQVRSRQNSRA
ncbi:MAG: hypothetical protein KatS3mg082_2535 [Nitrospiraceae bacterium]|nr:MAG: hypothetical protein KatS3mg082_2535 [Nitrospiraceae bacterium]